jgi:hypothetical protein
MLPPSQPPQVKRIELEWVVVSVAALKRWGFLILFVVLLGAGVAAVYYYTHEPASKRAERLLREASAAKEEVRRSLDSEGLQSEVEQASQLLDQARGDFDRRDYPACNARAEDALRRFQLLGGLANQGFIGAAQIIALQGQVEVQRANESRWNRAREKQVLNNGDFVKSGPEASAELLFADNTVFKVSPDSFLEIHREAREGVASGPAEVKVRVGQVNVNTSTNPSVVSTDVARAEVNRDSRVAVEVEKDGSTTVADYTGGAHVFGASGQNTDLASLQAVSASPAGALGPKRPVPDAPALERPAPNAVVNLDISDRVELDWRVVPGSTGYELQVSSSRIFAPGALQFPTNHRSTNLAVLKIHAAGKYYWRVAAVGVQALRSEWSSPRMFRASSGPRVEALAANKPPRLEVKRPTQMGNLILVEGITEPGATVTINGEPVSVAGDGTFRKTVTARSEGMNTLVVRAVDPAGLSTERQLTIFIETE